MAIKVLSIDDFSGGKNRIQDQTLISPSECASGSLNVWAPFGALTKTPGVTELAAFTATAGTCYLLFADNTVSTAYQLYYRFTTSTADITLNHYPWAGQSSSLTPLGYTTGTAALGGVSATGTGTSWSTHASAGDRFRMDGAPGTWYKVSSVEDDTHLTIDTAVTAAGAAYLISPHFSSSGGTQFITNAASLDGSVVMTSPLDVMQRFDGTGITRMPSGPKATFLTVFKNYMFAARTTTAESRLYWSAIKDPTSWPTNNFIDVDKGHGKIAGLYAAANELLVFKTYGLHRVVGDIFDPSNPTYSVQPIAVPSDFLFNDGRCIAVHRGRVYFAASSSRIFVYTPGSSGIETVSDKWWPDLGTTFDDLNSTTSNQAVVTMASFNDTLIIRGLYRGPGNTSDSGFTGGIVDRYGKWWQVVDNTGQPSLSASSITRGFFSVLPGSGSTKSRLVGTVFYYAGGNRLLAYDYYGPDFQDQYIHVGNGSELAISSIWISKEFVLDYARIEKIVVFLAKQSAGSINVSYSVDQGSFVSTSVDMTAGRGNIIRRTIPVNQMGSTIQFKIDQATVNQTFKVFGIRCYYEPLPEDQLS